MRNEIKEEIQAIAASLAGIGNENSYRVPDNYFEDLADEIISKIQLPYTQTPLRSPAPAYFEGLAGTILNKIKSNGTIVEEDSDADKELMELSPLLARVRKVNVYTVPAYYFTNFKVAIPAAEEKVKVLAMRQSLRWIQYAAAAAIAGIIAIGGIALFRSSGTDGSTQAAFTTNYTSSLSSLSDDAITNYLKDSPADIDITPSVYDDSKINTGNLTEQLLHDISDADIQEYLKENQQAGEKDIKGI